MEGGALIFQDTFQQSSECAEDISLDSVLFNKKQPIIVHEIFVFPNGVTSRRSDGQEVVGKSSPSSFQLDVFVNNLNHSNHAIFQHVGTLSYVQGQNHRLLVDALVPTDHVLFKGRYVSLSVAIIGEVTGLATASDYRIEGLHVLQPSQLPLLQPGPTSPASAPQLHLPSAAPASFGGLPFNPLVPPPPIRMTPSNYEMATSSNAPPSMMSIPPQPMSPPRAPPTGAPHHSLIVPYDPSRPPPMLAGGPIGGGAPSPGPSGSHMHHYQHQDGDSSHHARSSDKQRDRDRRSSRRSSSGDRSSRKRNRPVGSSSPPGADKKKRRRDEEASAPHDGDRQSSVYQQQHRIRGGERTRAFVSNTAPSSDTVVVEGKDTPTMDPMLPSTSKTSKADLLENISDDDFDFDDAAVNAELEITEADERYLDKMMKQFSVSDLHIEPLKSLLSPCLSQFERIALMMDESQSKGSTELSIAIEIYGRGCEKKIADWLQSLEKILPCFERDFAVALSSGSGDDDVSSVLVEWASVAIAYEWAVKQPQPALIIRHLKAGIRLVTAMFSTDRRLADMLVERCMHHRLLDLLEHQHMSLPMRLILLQALDASTFFSSAFDAFLNSRLYVEKHGAEVTPYQRLAKTIVGKQTSRYLSNAKALLRKVAFKESLQELKSFAQRIVEVGDDCHQLQTILLEELQNVCSHLDSVLLVMRNSSTLTQLRLKSLPLARCFALTTDDDDVSWLYRALKDNLFVESLIAIGAYATSSSSRLRCAITSAVEQLSTTQNGVLFLTDLQQTSRRLIDMLVHRTSISADDSGSSIGGDGGGPCGDVWQDAFYLCGVRLAHVLRCVQLIDRLSAFNTALSCKGEGVDSPPMMDAVRQLYLLTATAVGKKAVAGVLAMGDNFRAIISIMELTGDPETDVRIRKSASVGYAAELVLCAVRHDDNADIMLRYSDNLINIVSQQEGVSSRLSELKQWVEPMRRYPSGGSLPERVLFLAERIKDYNTAASADGYGAKMPPIRLVTALRLLRALVVQPDVDRGAERPTELCYREAQIAVLSADCYVTLLALIDRLADSNVIVWQQALSFQASRDGHLFFAAVVAVLATVRTLVEALIDARGNQFTDFTCLRPLLRVYAMCCSLLPTTAASSKESDIVRREVTRCFLAFTKPDLTAPRVATAMEATTPEGKTVHPTVPLPTLFSGSQWGRMIQEVIRFGLDAPSQFTAAICLFSEFLPLPTPCRCLQLPLLDEQQEAVLHRQKWSTQLKSVEDELAALLTLCCSGHPAMKTASRRFVLQLISLGYQTSVFVAKVLVRITMECATGKELKGPSTQCQRIGNDNQNDTADQSQMSETVAVTPKLPVVDSRYTTMVNLLSYLCSQGLFQVTLLNLLRAPESDDILHRLLPCLLETLNHVSSNTSHFLCQESIISFLAVLCDSRNVEQVVESTELVPIKCSPSLEQVCLICEALLKHIGDSNYHYGTVIPSLRLLVGVLKSGHGFYAIVKIWETDKKFITKLLDRLVAEFNGHSSDCLSTLSTVVELLNTLYERLINDEPPAIVGGRRLSLNLIALADADQPLSKLCKLLKKVVEEDSTLESYRIATCALYQALPLLKDKIEDVEGPSVPPDEYELTDARILFDHRRWFVVIASNDCPVRRQNSDEEDLAVRLLPQYWFPSSLAAEHAIDEQDGDKVSTDLEALRAEFLPTFNPKEELLKQIQLKQVDRVKRRVGRPGIINTSRGDGKHTGRHPAPLRGRGFVARGGGAQQRVHDSFRNRAPNTSRAPSMHVDDFLIMESQSHGVGGSVATGSNATTANGDKANVAVVKGRGGRNNSGNVVGGTSDGDLKQRNRPDRFARPGRPAFRQIRNRSRLPPQRATDRSSSRSAAFSYSSRRDASGGNRTKDNRRRP